METKDIDLTKAKRIRKTNRKHKINIIVLQEQNKELIEAIKDRKTSVTEHQHPKHW